jgi:hypothetical protein
MPEEQFKQEVEKELTGREKRAVGDCLFQALQEPNAPVIEQAIETAALTLGTDKSCGYCLEMICADFRAGANLGAGGFRCVTGLDHTILEVPSQRTPEDTCRSDFCESIMNLARSKSTCCST